MSNEPRRHFIRNPAITTSVALPASGMALAATAPAAKSSPKLCFNVLDFGAIPDGKTLCTTAIYFDRVREGTNGTQLDPGHR